MGGGGGVATRDTEPYIYLHMYIYTHMYSLQVVVSQTFYVSPLLREITQFDDCFFRLKPPTIFNSPSGSWLTERQRMRFRGVLHHLLNVFSFHYQSQVRWVRIPRVHNSLHGLHFPSLTSLFGHTTCVRPAHVDANDVVISSRRKSAQSKEMWSMTSWYPVTSHKLSMSYTRWH